MNFPEAQLHGHQHKSVVKLMGMSLSVHSILLVHVNCGANLWTELAYMLRRVELHGRDLAEGQSPWSIRQTAVYHRVMHPTDPNFKSMFLLIAPSERVETQLRNWLHRAISNDAKFSPYTLHLLLVNDSLRGWIDYIAWLGNQLKEQVGFKLPTASTY
jgi:hypothetical protein